MRAAIYTRVSTPRQARDQNTDQQLARLERYAEQKGWVLDGKRVYLDEGYSGHGARVAELVEEIAGRSLEALDLPGRHCDLQSLRPEVTGCQAFFASRPGSSAPGLHGSGASHRRMVDRERCTAQHIRLPGGQPGIHSVSHSTGLVLANSRLLARASHSTPTRAPWSTRGPRSTW